MSQFLTELEVVNFTGCQTARAQAYWMKNHGLLYYLDSAGKVVINRSCLDEVREQGWRKTLFLRQQDVFGQTRMPRRGIGVYFLLKRKEIIYVGKTTNFFVRMAAHDKGDLPFDGVAFFPFPPEDLDMHEHEYIRRFKPRHNVALTLKVIVNDE